MSRLITMLLLFTAISCNQINHFHDGVYHTEIGGLGMKIADVEIKINGNEIFVENSITGQSKFQCNQFTDRIEYPESNGTTTIIKVLENGNLKINGIYEAIKTSK